MQCLLDKVLTFDEEYPFTSGKILKEVQDIHEIL